MKTTKKIKQKESLNRVKELFEKAKKSRLPDEDIRKARKIAMKVNLKLPKELKRKFCKHCYTYFTKTNYRVRTRNNMIIYSCMSCKKYMRFKIR